MEESLRKKLEKLYVLSKRGEEHERNNAKQKLDTICKKYDVDLNQILNEDNVKERCIFYKTKEESTLIVHCVYDVNKSECYTNEENPRHIYFTSTDVDYVLICENYEFYKNEYYKEKNNFLKAFIMKNNIGLDEAKGDSKIGEEEWKEIEKFYNIISINTPQKKINND